MSVREQILEVRDSGEVNMFDVNGVQRVALDMGHYELVEFLSDRDRRGDYCKFIMTGEATERLTEYGDGAW